MNAQLRELPGWGDSSPPDPTPEEADFSARFDALRNKLPSPSGDSEVSVALREIVDLGLDHFTFMSDEDRYKKFRAFSWRLEVAMINQIERDIKCDAQP